MFIRAPLLFSASLITLSAFAGTALAQDSVLTLVLAGEAFDGPPAFSVTFNGQVIGQGAVETAIDTTTKGPLVSDGKVNAEPQKFSIPIPAEVFDPHATLEISFTNDKYSDVGKVSDRNLYIVSADINGRTISSKEFSALYLGSPGENPLVGGMVELLTNKNSAQAAAPEGGWPSPVVASTSVPVKPQTSGVDTTPAAGGKPAANAAPPKPLCTFTSDIMVDGFTQNTVALSTSQTGRLNDLIKKVRNQQCSIRIIGYSDTVGPKDLNVQVSRDRAQAVADYLSEKGVTFSKYELTAFGPTKQFGPSSAANRVVELQISP